MYYVIELWRPRKTWHDLPHEQRTAFLAGMSADLDAFTAAGIQPVAMGTTEPLIEESPWAFYAVWQAATREAVEDFAANDNPELDGYFELVRISGAGSDPAGLAHAMTALP